LLVFRMIQCEPPMWQGGLRADKHLFNSMIEQGIKHKGAGGALGSQPREPAWVQVLGTKDSHCEYEPLKLDLN